ncbi:MAG: triose-phosphate isomerase [Chlamydiota bacterium]
MTHRPTYLIANWKLHMTGALAAQFVAKLRAQLPPKPSAHVWIAPPYTAIVATVKAAEDSPLVVGAQNVSEYEQGAYTGEVSAAMLAAEKAQFALIGHSERRALFGETDEVIQRKIARVCAAELCPVLCIGETESERNKGLTKTVLERQLEKGLSGLSNEALNNIIVAYEPVWAIGTGKAATPEIAAEAHQLCRQFLAKNWGKTVAMKTPLLYGGSVKPDNIAALLNCDDIDGALIGGASLEVDTLSTMVELTQENM